MKKRFFAIALAAIMTMTAATLVGCDENTAEPIAVSTTATPSEAIKATGSTLSTNSTTAPLTVPETTTATTANTPTVSTTKGDSNKTENKSSASTQSNSNVAVTGVSLSRNSISLYEGDSATFEVVISPENATDRQYNVVTNNGNASIDCNGSTVTIYGENSGSCDITVSSTNGKSATCSVSVNARTSYNNGGSGNSGGNSGGNNGNSGNSGAITDDTMLTHAQICTDEVMDRVVAEVNSYFQAKGMTYDSSLNIHNRGWFLSGTNYYQGDYYYNLNRMIYEETTGFDGELRGSYYSNPQEQQWYDISEIYNTSFRCYHERQSNGEYRIYFCYG